MPEEYITYRVFFEHILEINKQRALEIDSIRTLILTTAENAEKGDLLRHTNLRNAVDKLGNDFDARLKEINIRYDKHQEEDDAVEKRVTILEETQKRIIWLVTLIFPSAIAVWETIKNKLGMGK